jgi:predicted membrane-bound dolichyl-phosphate-mannose-protein mannosyltransferase
MALLAGGAARRESVTIDEVAHVAAGVSYLQKLDLRMNEEHPPLAKVLAALAAGAARSARRLFPSLLDFQQQDLQPVFGRVGLRRLVPHALE